MSAQVTTSQARTAPAAGLTPRKLYFVLAIAEACTWTALIVGLILKANSAIDPMLLTTIGGIHGFVFISYGATAILVGINQRWHFGVGLLAVITAILPYATIPFEIVQAKRGALDGVWRLEATDDPRDQHWFDKLVRWFLNRPLLLALAILVGILSIFASLLIMGPPGGTK
jgi:integral membrane protein